MSTPETRKRWTQIVTRCSACPAMKPHVVDKVVMSWCFRADRKIDIAKHWPGDSVQPWCPLPDTNANDPAV